MFDCCYALLIYYIYCIVRCVCIPSPSYSFCILDYIMITLPLPPGSNEGDGQMLPDRIGGAVSNWGLYPLYACHI